MLLIKTYTAPDSFGGTGLFSEQFIAAGTAVWTFDARIDVFYSCSEYERLDPDTRQKIAKYLYSAVRDGIQGVIYSRDDDRYTNHSFAPNTGGDDPNRVIALRDIKSGEEITANYFDFIPQRLPPFYGELCYAFLLAEEIDAPAVWGAVG